MPVANGLTTKTQSKNNPRGDKIHVGTMVDADIFKAFDKMCDEKVAQKSSVLRRPIADFAATGEFASSSSGAAQGQSSASGD